MQAGGGDKIKKIKLQEHIASTYQIYLRMDVTFTEHKNTEIIYI
jgi:hypothetical protein